MDQRETERLGLEITNNAMEMVIVFDERGEIRFSNQTANRELGYEDGMDDVNLKTIVRRPFQMDGLELEFSVDQIQDITETVLYKQNESCFPVSVKIQPSEVCPGCYQLFATNITRRLELNKQIIKVREEASEAMKARNEFVANVTHELRTPLNGMRGHLAALRESGLDAEQNRTMDIIMQCCENMGAIINNILDFSKLEAGKFTIERANFNFRKMVNHVIDTSITAINDKGLYLIVNVADDIPENLCGDELRIVQILNNLLSNAIKFTSIGYISIDITKTLEFGNEIELFFMVSDTGIGMTQEEQDKIFRSFTQVDASITRRYGGTGLGLVITKQLVELMGGTINLESEKGKGSTFSFGLRLNRAEEAEGDGTDSQEREAEESLMLYKQNSGNIGKFDRMEKFFAFGSPENVQEIHNKMEKLIICLELEAWDKAESFAANLKSLLSEKEDLKKAVFRLEMCLRKEDYEKSMKRYQELKDLLDAEIGGI